MRSFKTKSAKPADPGKVFIRYSILISLGLIIIMLILAGIVYLITLEGEEKVKVPDIMMLDAVEGIVELQVKHLMPFIQRVYTSDDSDKNLIVNQSPASGTTIRAGARVVLSVSQGKVVDELEDYTGRAYDIVKNEIYSYYPEVSILPVTEIIHESEYGTILEQQPQPGEKITSDTELKFVISMGQQGEIIQVPDLAMLQFDQAIMQCIRNSLTFYFTVSHDSTAAESGRVIKQTPAAGEKIKKYTQIELEIGKPSGILDGKVFGVFPIDMNILEAAITLNIEIINTDGSSGILYTMKHPGGLISFPYIEMPGTVFKVYKDETEIFSFIVPEN